ncbi:hypothetical protein LJC22_06825 [Desulfosarcina sp. OttesenSCG-928-G10]|nr:hypothetical protein [Desulfosarcina sp. OttesenSCG-928-G10]MDL2320748.1 hypothetical protein [Desulfosarcina sp. OttesenSCG-928-B08]
MRMICPSCGAMASLEAWSSDAGARGLLAAVCDLPGGVVHHIPAYLALFRPVESARALSWSRATKVVKDLSARIADGHIRHGREVSRPCPAGIWAEALEKIVHRPPPQLPLTTNGYLIRIAYDLANEADKAAEARRNQAERDGTRQHSRTTENTGLNPMSPEEMRAIRERNMRKKHGTGTETTGSIPE